MHRKLDRVRSGVLDSYKFKLRESIRRSNTLGLSNFVELESAHTAAITCIDADNKNGSYLLSGCIDGSLYIHDLRNYTTSPHYVCRAVHKINKTNRFAHMYSVETVQWYPFDCGIFITSGLDKTLKVWDANRMEPAENLQIKGKIYQHHVSQVPSPTTSLVALATTEQEVFLVDVRTGSKTHELRGHTDSVLSCKWSPTMEFMLATGSTDKKILLWDVRKAKDSLKDLDMNNGKCFSRQRESVVAHDGMVNGLCFTRNGMHLISCGTDNRMRLWNVGSGDNELVNYGSMLNNAKKSIQFDVSFSSGEELIYVPCEGLISVHSVHKGWLLKKLVGHYNSVNCCYFHPSKIQLFSGANDKLILCWASETVEDDCEENDRNEFVFDSEWSEEEN